MNKRGYFDIGVLHIETIVLSELDPAFNLHVMRIAKPERRPSWHTELEMERMLTKLENIGGLCRFSFVFSSILLASSQASAHNLKVLASVDSRAGWADLTVYSLLLVLFAGLVGTLTIYTMGRSKWVPPTKLMMLSRAMQILFGISLLAACFMPYLSVHSPVFALILLGLFFCWGLYRFTNLFLEDEHSANINHG